MTSADESLGSDPRAGCWPTHRQRLLLRAALLDGDAAVASWREWRRSADIGAADTASRRLLPLLYRNLTRLGVEDPEVRDLKETFARTYFQNRLLFARAATVLRALRDAGIPTMVLKGLALVPRYYRDDGLRPMDDFDVLGPSERAVDAMRVLRTAGWTPAHPHPEQRVPIVHSTSFADSLYRQCDLHWEVIGEGWYAARDRLLWDAAVPLTLEGVPTLALAPAHQLLHVCAHGVRWDDPSPIRWIADAMAVVRAAGDTIDWRVLCDEAIQRHLVLPVGDGLAYLVEHLDASIPADVVRTLRAAPVTRLERYHYESQTREYWQPSALEIMRILRYDYRRLATNTPPGRRLGVFAGRTRERFQLTSLWHILPMAMRGLTRRAFKAPAPERG